MFSFWRRKWYNATDIKVMCKVCVYDHEKSNTSDVHNLDEKSSTSSSSVPSFWSSPLLLSYSNIRENHDNSQSQNHNIKRNQNNENIPPSSLSTSFNMMINYKYNFYDKCHPKNCQNYQNCQNCLHLHFCSGSDAFFNNSLHSLQLPGGFDHHDEIHQMNHQK